MGMYTMRTPSDSMIDCRTPGCDESMDQDDMTDCERCDRDYCRDCSTDFKRGVCLGCSEDEDEAAQ